MTTLFVSSREVKWPVEWNCLTLAEALKYCKPGDVIYVDPGHIEPAGIEEL